VVVGPGGVYCISTKAHRGLFTGTPDGLLHNGDPIARQAWVNRQLTLESVESANGTLETETEEAAIA
jgi:hypothetical protein